MYGKRDKIKPVFLSCAGNAFYANAGKFQYTKDACMYDSTFDMYLYVLFFYLYTAEYVKAQRRVYI